MARKTERESKRLIRTSCPRSSTAQEPIRSTLSEGKFRRIGHLRYNEYESPQQRNIVQPIPSPHKIQEHLHNLLNLRHFLTHPIYLCYVHNVYRVTVSDVHGFENSCKCGNFTEETPKGMRGDRGKPTDPQACSTLKRRTTVGCLQNTTEGNAFAGISYKSPNRWPVQWSRSTSIVSWVCGLNFVRGNCQKSKRIILHSVAVPSLITIISVRKLSHYFEFAAVISRGNDRSAREKIE